MSRAPYPHRFTDLTDALIPVYNWGFRVLGGRSHEAFRQHVVDLAALQGGECLLDAGCGTGMLALRIAAQYPDCTVHGVDISPKMIAVARHDAQEQDLSLDLRVGSMLELPYPDGSFDVVFTTITYHHLDLAEKRQAVNEIARVLRGPEPHGKQPGGRYVSAEFGPRASNALQRHLAKGEYTLYPSHLTDAGLSIVHEQVGVLALQKKVVYRVAFKQLPRNRSAAG
jgi:ubiquinone/menaquinone biosynthesis C-methylase UbiE